MQDQSLFRTVLYMHNHVMHRLLPPKKRLQYKLRPRNHNLALTCRTSYYDNIVILLPVWFLVTPIDSIHMFLLLYFILRSVVAYRIVIAASIYLMDSLDRYRLFVDTVKGRSVCWSVYLIKNIPSRALGHRPATCQCQPRIEKNIWRAGLCNRSHRL